MMCEFVAASKFLARHLLSVVLIVAVVTGCFAQPAYGEENNGTVTRIPFSDDSISELPSAPEYQAFPERETSTLKLVADEQQPADDGPFSRPLKSIIVPPPASSLSTPSPKITSSRIKDTPSLPTKATPSSEVKSESDSILDFYKQVMGSDEPTETKRKQKISKDQGKASLTRLPRQETTQSRTSEGENKSRVSASPLTIAKAPTTFSPKSDSSVGFDPRKEIADAQRPLEVVVNEWTNAINDETEFRRMPEKKSRTNSSSADRSWTRIAKGIKSESYPSRERSKLVAKSASTVSRLDVIEELPAGNMASPISGLPPTTPPPAIGLTNPMPITASLGYPGDSSDMFRRAVVQPDWSRVFGQACGQCSSSSCCCCRQTKWTASAGVLFLDRSRSDGFDDFLTVCDQTEVGVRGRDVDFDMTGGPWVSVARNNLCGGLDIEGIFYQIEEFSGNGSHVGDLVIRGVNFLGDGTSFVDYESRLRNVELNLSKWCTNWTKFIVGGRWLQLEETGSISATTAAFPNYRDQVDVENSLVGGQIGIQHVIWDRGNTLSVVGTVKGGLLVNNASRSTIGFGSTPLSENETSLIGEFDLTANYRWTDRWSFSLGYQFLAISDAALALDQFLSPDQIFYQDILLQGFRLGVNFTY